MARLIDADWLLNAIEKLKVRNTSSNSTIFDVLGVLDDVEKIIKAAPINEPVKHGHWIFVKDVVAYIKDMVSYIKSSECGDDICWVNTKRPKYCPSCGARMDGSAND